MTHIYNGFLSQFLSIRDSTLITYGLPPLPSPPLPLSPQVEVYFEEDLCAQEKQAAEEVEQALAQVGVVDEEAQREVPRENGGDTATDLERQMQKGQLVFIIITTVINLFSHAL